MAVENNVAISSKQFVAGKSATNNNAVKTPSMPQDSVEISSKKEKKEVSKGKILAFFAGALLLAGGLGALTHKFITTRPAHVKKQMADTLGRSLTNDEIAKIDEKCKKSYTGWDFFDDILTGLLFI